MAVIQLTQANFDEVMNSQSLLVLDFWAQWCEPCKAFATTFETVAAEYPDVVFAKINIEEETTLAEEWEIRSVPMLMVLREDVLLFAEAGALPASGLRDLIDQALALDMDKVRAEIAAEEQASKS